MQPTFRQVPPKAPRPSTQATFIPSWAALIAATYPPGPPPITTKSCCSAEAERFRRPVRKRPASRPACRREDSSARNAILVRAHETGSEREGAEVHQQGCNMCLHIIGGHLACPICSSQMVYVLTEALFIGYWIVLPWPAPQTRLFPRQK